MPTTEIAGFPLVRDVDIDDPDTEAAARIGEWSESIVKQEGHQESWYGIVEERKDELVAIISMSDCLAGLSVQC